MSGPPKAYLRPSNVFLASLTSRGLDHPNDDLLSLTKLIPTIGQWDELLRAKGFSGVDGFGMDTSHTYRAIFSSAVIAQGERSSQVTILYDEKPSDELLEHLRVSLEQLTGQLPTFSSLNEGVEDIGCCIFLELDKPLLPSLNEYRLRQLQSLFSKATGALWVVRGANTQAQIPEANMSSGLARCIRSEIGGIKLVTLDLQKHRQLSNEDSASTITRMFEVSFGANSPPANVDLEYRETNGVIQIPRLFPDSAKDKYITRQTNPPTPEIQDFVQGRNLRLSFTTPGLLESLCFFDAGALRESLDEDELQIRVQAVSMNFKDALIGLGQVPYQEPGFECSGFVTAMGSGVSGFSVGDRVCALSGGEYGGAYSNFARSHYQGTIKIPDEMSFTTAASIPIVFCTAYHALFEVGRLAKGESVLIHAAAGGVGQAATMLCQTIGAEIYITVGTKEKKDLMMSRYNIAEERVFSSRDLTFEEGVLKATNGKGVNVILNSVAGEALRLTWNLLQPLGRFLEIGKRDLEINTRLEMNNFLKATTFAAIDLGILAQHNHAAIQNILTKVFSLLRDGAIQTVFPITVYPMSEVKKGLRQMQSGKHMGKIVIEARKGDQVLVCHYSVTLGL